MAPCRVGRRFPVDDDVPQRAATGQLVSESFTVRHGTALLGNLHQRDAEHMVFRNPEDVFRTTQMSWHPAGLGEDSPWMTMFRNARRRVS
jgi:hypothetical protein